MRKKWLICLTAVLLASIFIYCATRTLTAAQETNKVGTAVLIASQFGTDDKEIVKTPELIDGDTSTRWITHVALPTRLLFDMGVARTVVKVRICNYSRGGNNFDRGVKVVDIFVGNTLAPATAGAANVATFTVQPSTKDALVWSDITLPQAQKGRFLTLRINSNWGGNAVAANEVEIYTVEADVPLPNFPNNPITKPDPNPPAVTQPPAADNTNPDDAPGAEPITAAARCVLVSATTTTQPPAIILNWPMQPDAKRYLIYRKERWAKTWGNPLVTLPAGTTKYQDNNVKVGEAFEYQIIAAALTPKQQQPYLSYGFIYAGIALPMIDQRGTLILLVDNTVASDLDAELTRLQEDIIGDGWEIIRHDVSRTQSVMSVKRLIQADYAADPSRVKALLLFGHIPVPYSGCTATVRHENAIGAQPADLFYADVDGVWTDTLVNRTGGVADPRYINVPGDGKFDQSVLPSDSELQIGRIDLANMATSFPGESETSLLKRYLDKDHAFRYGLLPVPRRGKINDTLQALSNGSDGSSSGWRNFAAFFGAGAVDAVKGWFQPPNKPANDGYLWGCAVGGGSYIWQSAFGATTQFKDDPLVVFSTISGSYCGDWDHPDDIMRAPLCTPTHGLGCTFGVPHLYMHTIALGDTIGAGMWLTQNNDGITYPDTDQPDLFRGKYGSAVWIDWMGDITLRLNPILPPSNLRVKVVKDGTADLAWVAADEQALQGYLVYRAIGEGKFTRLTNQPILATNFQDTGVKPGIYRYMVRAVKLEVNGSGSYYNPSQGIFALINVNAHTPAISLLSPLPATSYTAPATIFLRAKVDDNFTGSVEFYNGAEKLVTVATAPFVYQWQGVTGGKYNLTAKAIAANGTATTSPVPIMVSDSSDSLLPGNWMEINLEKGVTGAASFATNSFTVNGNGSGLQGTADACHLVYQPLLNDGEMVVRLASKDDNTTAGVVLRNTILPDSSFAAIIYRPDGSASFINRPSSGKAVVEAAGDKFTLPCWLKIRREGKSITAYVSQNNATWKLSHTIESLVTSSTPLVGFFAISDKAAVPGTATFDRVTVRSDNQPPYTWFRSPWDGATFTAGTPINLQVAKPFDDEGLYQSIAFFADDVDLKNKGISRGVIWNGATPGVHTITAKVTDDQKMVGSLSINITVNPTDSHPPNVLINNPVDGAFYTAPVDLPCAVDIVDNGIAITQVEYIANGKSLAIVKKAPFIFDWQQVPVGHYLLLVRATNELGAVTQSAPVIIYITDK